MQNMINPRLSLGQQLLIFHPETDGDNPNLRYPTRSSPAEDVVFWFGFSELKL